MNPILVSALRTFEIEAKAIQQLAKRLNADFEKTVQAILQSQGRVVVSGMGKSGLIGKKISATLASTGTPSFFMHPAEALHGDLGMLLKEDIVLAISNSGETDELIRLIPSIKKIGNVMVALTGNNTSTLAKNAHFVLDVSVDEEACPLQLAPTASTTATLAMGDALAVALIQARNFQPEDFAGFHPGGNLGRKLLTRVEDIMIRKNIPLVAPEDSIQTVISAITQGRLGLVVVLQNEKIAGVVTDGDLRRALEKKDRFFQFSARDIMSSTPKTITPDKMVVEAEEVMTKHKIVSLLVEKDQRLVGVVQIYNLQFDSQK